MNTKFALGNYSTVILTALCLLVAVSGKSAVQFFSGATANKNWDTSTLNWGATGGPYNAAWVNGNDAVFQGTAATVTNLGVSANSLAFSVANGVLTLTTPTNTWFDVPGSESSTQSVLNINIANPAVFYRLRMP